MLAQQLAVGELLRDISNFVHLLVVPKLVDLWCVHR
jgi:hypothetical protein